MFASRCPDVDDTDTVCNKCFQIYKNREELYSQIGPKFDGITTLTWRRNSDTRHLYNGLFEEKLCEFVNDERICCFKKDGSTPPILPINSFLERIFKQPLMLSPKINHDDEMYIMFIINRLTHALREKNRPTWDKTRLIIGGSFALYQYLVHINKHVNWRPHDFDIFVVNGNTSANTYINKCRLLAYILGESAGNNWVRKYSIPDNEIDFVRTNCEDIQGFIDSVDTSLNQILIVHKLTKIPKDMVVIKRVDKFGPIIDGEIKPTDNDHWLLIATQKAVTDIENNTLTYHTPMKSTYYPKTMERVAKYHRRGFTNVVYEPKEIKWSLGGYIEMNE